jgi:hypothetical protein
MTLKDWSQYLYNELVIILKSKNPLPWSLIALLLASAARTQLSNFHHNASVIHILFSVLIEMITLVSVVAVMRWRWKYTSAFLAFIALLIFLGSTSIIYRYAQAFQLLNSFDQPYLATSLVLNALVEVLSVVVFVLAIKYMLSQIRMENKYKKISTPELLRMHFEANQVLWELSKMQKEPALVKITREANRDVGWSKYELTRRDEHLGELIKAMANKDSVDKTANEIIREYGWEVLVPLERGWNPRESHYFTRERITTQQSN